MVYLAPSGSHCNTWFTICHPYFTFFFGRQPRHPRPRGPHGDIPSPTPAETDWTTHRRCPAPTRPPPPRRGPRGHRRRPHPRPPIRRRAAGHGTRLRARRTVPALARRQTGSWRRGRPRILRRRPVLVPQPHRVGSRVHRGGPGRPLTRPRLRPRPPRGRPLHGRRHFLRGQQTALQRVRVRQRRPRHRIPPGRHDPVALRHRGLHLLGPERHTGALASGTPVPRRPLDRLHPRREPSRRRERRRGPAQPGRRGGLRLRRDPRGLLPGDHQPPRRDPAFTRPAVVARLAPHRHPPLRRARWGASTSSRPPTTAPSCTRGPTRFPAIRSFPRANCGSSTWRVGPGCARTSTPNPATTRAATPPTPPPSGHPTGTTSSTPTGAATSATTDSTAWTRPPAPRPSSSTKPARPISS